MIIAHTCMGENILCCCLAIDIAVLIDGCCSHIKSTNQWQLRDSKPCFLCQVKSAPPCAKQLPCFQELRTKDCVASSTVFLSCTSRPFANKNNLKIQYKTHV